MIVFLLRHADRLPEPKDELSAQGRERARLLARMLADCRVAHAFCSDAKRTMQTLQPLKDQLGAALSITSVATDGPAGITGHVTNIVSSLEALPVDAVAIVVGHTNTIPPIVKKLGGLIDPI